MGRLLTAALLVATTLGSGCSLTRPAPVKHTYLLEAPRPLETAAPAVDGTLRVGLFGTAPAFLYR